MNAYVVAAWGRAHEIEEIATNCPEGDVVAHARRLVAQRCLYGVDKNAMAVQLAKLSLWLFTLARDLPFTFLDHSLRHGDSLVGLDLEQIKAFHWKPEKQLSFLEAEIKQALDEVVSIRKEIHQLAGDATPAGQRLKVQRLFDASDATEKVRRIADVCVGAFFANDKDKNRLAQRQVREDSVHAWLAGDAEANNSVAEWADQIRQQHSPFHWWLEFPEVFYEARPDPLATEVPVGSAYMDGFVGNPPFLAGRDISGAWGIEYRDWLYQSAEGAKNLCDLCAYFLRRSNVLLGAKGTMGFIATNTIAQGDTRIGGLKVLLQQEENEILFARDSMPWPGHAVVTISLVVIGRAVVPEGNQRELNGAKCLTINSHLRPRPERPDPISLHANQNLVSQGSKIYGQGFVLTDREQTELKGRSARNAERIFPYLGGAEITTSPVQGFEEYVISFHGMNLIEASKWTDLITIVRDRVKPERDGLSANNASARALKTNWWRFQAHRPDLYRALAPLDRCIVTAGISTHRVFAFQPTDRIWSHNVYVFPLDTWTAFAVLQSRIHERWTNLLASGLGDTTGYRPTDCFYNFPFPQRDPRTPIPELEAAGKSLYEALAIYMVEKNQGLTKVYNALKAPDCDDDRVLELRNLHEEMDRVVLEAYGWTGIEVPPFCSMDKEDEDAQIRFTDDVIDCLYLLNAERTSEEERKTTNDKLAARNSTSKQAQKEASSTMSLPGMDDVKGVNS